MNKWRLTRVSLLLRPLEETERTHARAERSGCWERTVCGELSVSLSVSLRGSMCDSGRRKTDRHSSWLKVGLDGTEHPLLSARGRPPHPPPHNTQTPPPTPPKRTPTHNHPRHHSHRAVRETQRGRDGRQRHPEDVHQEETGTD